ncbi:MAG: AAA family ATPase [Rhodospirillaceae bacterium]|mgnify:FL=1|jgi:hypothetical protein|nr:AAA family ATPase [Rhodospirillales bacterium]MBT4117370.1 AAA family ATPase [Rhodospirillaceae bacterium]MBT5840369.1 AAA family ATPase [Rhodospirillaceae bacterium]MBT7235716.1 AAA family ATPase [Rhodospirillaceae bacterium]MBT7570417.1 AAA family ATPase [Rhodospirillaceae bacterium]
MSIVIKKAPAKSNQFPFNGIKSASEAAIKYDQYGFDPVPLVPESKKPAVKWKDYSFDPAQAQTDFGDGRGVALRMGQGHGGLADIDLDSPEARMLAAPLLPKTDCVFGRESSSPGHFIYQVDGSVKSTKYEAVVGGEKTLFAEIRGDDQLTMFPCSTHPTGETVRFEKGKSGHPTHVGYSQLIKCLGQVCAASLLARIWAGSEGFRQDMAMAVAGGMLNAKRSPQFVETFILNVAIAAGDDEAQKRADVVAPTFEKIKAGKAVTGWPTLINLIGQDGNDLVQKITEGLSILDDTMPPMADDIAAGSLDVVLASQVSVKEVEWFWQDRVAYGAITILDGDPSMGKSTICLDLAARQSAGLGLPGGMKCDPAGVLILSCEDNYDTTVVPRLIAANADIDKIALVGNVTFQDGSTELISIPEGLGLIRDTILNIGARLLIIEPLVAFFGASTHTHNDQQIRRALGPLKSLAEETGVAVIAVRHLTKKTGSSAMYRGGGSIGMIGAARTALLVGHDPYEPDSRVLAVTKNNLGKYPKSWQYQLESQTGSMDDDQHWEAPAVNWIGLTDVTANELVSEPKPEKTGALKDARDFLVQLLEDGPKAVSDIETLAVAEGHSKSTIKKARKELGIKPNQVFSEGKILHWEWGLPEKPTIG